MKIDYDLINTFPQLGLYQSKAAIAGYAEENFGLKIQRNLSYENMVKKLEEHVAKIAPAPVEKFKLEVPVVDVELEEALESTPVVETVTKAVDLITKDAIENIQTDAFLETIKIAEMAKAVSNSNDRKADLMSLLPPDFKPCFTPMGNHETFYPLSYWINDWIQATPDWCYRINEYERIQEHKFLYTLVYYIALYGKFVIRETRNSEFVTLS